MSLPLTLDRSSREPLYRQVERQIRDAIDAGRARPGDRVPSVRELAGQLDVGRLTVATAYEQLAADGYLVARVGFGTIVAPALRVTALEASAGPAPRASTRLPTPPDGSAPGPAVLPAKLPASSPTVRPDTPRRSRFDLRPGALAGAGMAVGPALERLLREAWRDLANGIREADPAGDPLLRATIAAHVRTTRGGRCEPDQVVVLSGGIMGVAAIVRLWLTAGRSLALEDPPDPVFRRNLDLAATRVVPVATDANGLRLDALPAGAAAVLAGPRVQPVTGVQMPLARRLGLLAWASGAGAVVVEDARADDLAAGAAGPSLQGLDEDGRVIHLGAFAALLHPGIQLGYAVVPRDLVAPFTAAVGALDPGATPVQQLALGRWLADGHLDRHLARVRRSLAERFDAATTALRRDLGWLVSAEPPAGGTKLLVSIEDDVLTATRAAAAAAREGVAVEPLSRLRIGATVADRELIVDVGRHEPGDLAAAIGALARALAEERRRGRHDRAHRAPAAIAPIPRRWPAVTRAADRREAGPVHVGVTRAAREG